MRETIYAGSSRANRRLYDWDDWFSGRLDRDNRVRIMLHRGHHYECSQSSMMQQIRVAACHRGEKVAVVNLQDKISLVVMPKEIVL